MPRHRWQLFGMALALVGAASTARAQGVEEEVVGGGVFDPSLLEEEEAVTETDPEAEGDDDEEGAAEALAAPAAAPEGAPPPLESPTSPPPGAVRELVRFELENGLRGVVQPVPGRRFVAVAVTYGVGHRDDPDGYSGLAHLTEHLMFTGSDEMNELEVFLRLEAMGAVERQAATFEDHTVYWEEVPSSQLGWALWLEAHRMARMAAGLTEPRVDRQREVVLDEGWDRAHFGGSGRQVEVLHRHLYPPGHPYHGLVYRPDDLRAIRARHVQWFFQRHYAPDAAVVTLVGDVDPARAEALVRRYFGPIRRSGPAPERRDGAVRPLAEEHLVRLRMQRTRDLVQVAWPTPSWRAPGDAALDVIADLLDEALRRELVEPGIALAAGARQRSRLHGSFFSIAAEPAAGHGTAELLAGIDRALASVRAAAPSGERLDAARARFVRSMDGLYASLGGRAGLLGHGMVDGGEPATPATERARYEAVDAAAVAETLTRWLPAGRRLVIVVEADRRAPPEGRIVEDRSTGGPR